MKNLMGIGFMVLASAFLPTVASAAGHQRPQVEYSADSYMETADNVTKGPVNVAPGKERREYIENDNAMVMIIRHDKKITWMLMPADKTYMEMKIPEEGRKDDISNYKIDATTVGPEVVNGVQATKSKVIMVAPNGDKMGGLWWISKEGVVVKLDAISVVKGSKDRFTTNLENLKFGKQDPSLFEIPEGYTKMDMGGFGSMMFGGDNDDGGDDGGDDAKQPAPKKKKRGFGFRDALDLIK